MDFNEYGAPVGAEDGLLAGYCGTLAIDCNLFSVSFDKWSGRAGAPKRYKEDCCKTILKVLIREKTDSKHIFLIFMQLKIFLLS